MWLNKTEGVGQNYSFDSLLKSSRLTQQEGKGKTIANLV